MASKSFGWGASLRFVALGAALTLGACAGQQRPAVAPMDQPNDPIEGVNRAIHGFNQAVDTVVVRPLAIVYRDGVPENLQDRVHDFLTNLATPVTLLNDLLQGEWKRAERTTARFFINTTIGVGGLADVAGAHGLPGHQEDFGQTLAVWGVSEGPYIVLPLLGPSNARDTVGLVVDVATDPLTYLLNRRSLENWDTRPYGYARYGLRAIDQRARLVGPLDDLKANSVDFYVAMRTAYRQRRNTEILNDRPAPGTPSNVPGLDAVPAAKR